MVGSDRWLSEPPCTRQGVPQTEPEFGYNICRGGTVFAVISWARAPAAAKRRCSQTGLQLYLLTFSHFLIVNKTSLSPPPARERLLSRQRSSDFSVIRNFGRRRTREDAEGRLRRWQPRSRKGCDQTSIEMWVVYARQRGAFNRDTVPASLKK